MHFDITCGCSRPIDNLVARKCWRGWKSEFIHKFIEKPGAYRGGEWKQVMGINTERNLMAAAVPTRTRSMHAVGAPDVVVAVLPSALNTTTDLATMTRRSCPALEGFGERRISRQKVAPTCNYPLSAIITLSELRCCIFLLTIAMVEKKPVNN
jgi:hypothetical protein